MARSSRFHVDVALVLVTPAQAGVQSGWIPAFAGMTKRARQRATHMKTAPIAQTSTVAGQGCRPSGTVAGMIALLACY